MCGTGVSVVWSMWEAGLSYSGAAAQSRPGHHEQGRPALPSHPHSVLQGGRGAAANVLLLKKAEDARRQSFAIKEALKVIYCVYQPPLLALLSNPTSTKM